MNRVKNLLSETPHYAVVDVHDISRFKFRMPPQQHDHTRISVVGEANYRSKRFNFENSNNGVKKDTYFY